jgi:Asp/Glu/hydantoin racemase
MKLLLINPNTTQRISELIDAEARRAAAPDTEVLVLTAPFGVSYIETRFEALIGAYAAATLAAEHWDKHDAIVVAAFGDPGIDALREALDIPVIGMAEAALMSACLLGKRFSIVAISPRITAWYRECVRANGLIERLASIRSLDRPVQDIGRVQEEHLERLLALCMSAVDDDGADVIVIAGAPLAGLARSIKDRIPVPVVDGVSSAVCHAQTLVSLAPTPARRGSFAPPPVKPNLGLSEAIVRLLARGGA